MQRRRDDDPPWIQPWTHARSGRWWKRRVAKALRRCARAACNEEWNPMPTYAMNVVRNHGREPWYW
jgi:hypothetical protein